MRGRAFSTMVVSGFFAFAFAIAANAASVKATGCLEKGDGKDEFQLSHATGGGAERYELVPDKGVDLNAHVGHKVEITGETASEASEQKEKPHPHLKVKSLRHLAAQCP